MKRCEWSFVVVSEEGGNKSRCYQVSTRTIVMAYIIICLSIGGLVRAAVVLNSKAIISFASRFERKKGENLREIAEALDSQADLVLGRNKKSGFLASMPQIRFIAPEFVHASFPILPLPRKKTFNKVVPVEDQFLVNKAEYLRPHLPPVRGRINSHFGIRADPLNEETAFHEGIDIGTKYGEPVQCAAKGIVLFAGNKGKWGNVVVILHEDLQHTTIYAHLHKFIVKKGQRVRASDCLGYVGMSGKTTGPHLHYEVRKRGKPVNPVAYLIPVDSITD